LLFVKDKRQKLQHFVKLGGKIVLVLLRRKITTFEKLRVQNALKPIKNKRNDNKGQYFLRTLNGKFL